MQFKSFALLAVASTGAVAQLSIPTDPAGLSLLSVLATAIPTSIQQLALSSPAALVSQLQSSIAAGNTPSWYAALPTDVKSALPSLFPAATSAIATPTSASSSAEETVTTTETTDTGATGTASITNIRNSTSITTIHSATLKTTAAETTVEQVNPTSSSTGGASYPTAVFGAGVAGALGVIGMLAL